jgi:cell wall-associated NlpC family hydrolase
VRPLGGLAFVLNRLSPRGIGLGVLIALALALSPAAALAEPPSIADKRAEARQVLGQIDELDRSLGLAIEEYNRATVRLDEIKGAQAINRRQLAIARRNLERSQVALGRHLVAMYVAGEDNSGLGVLLGATSLTNFIDRLETLERVAEQDERVAREVKVFKRTIELKKRRLAKARQQQDDLVELRAAENASIDGRLAERRQLVESIRSEITRLEAEERARQERLRREAEARLREQQAEAARLALQRQAALEQARQSGATELGAQEAADAVAPDPSGSLGIVASTPDAMVAPSSQYGGVVGEAMQYLGVPYVWGGASPSGFDCSGLVVYVFAKFGVSLPHYTGDLWNMGVPVSRDQLEAGDLVFFNGLGHMGIYIGGGQFIHAPHTGDVVKISNMSDGWYTSSYDGARRIL